MSDENKIPLPGQMETVPDFLKGDNWFQEDVGGDFLDFEKPYRPPRYTMERDGVAFADVGELHIISGKPGNGKTGLMSQLMATMLCGQHGNTLRRDVPHKVKNPDTGEDEEKMVPNVLLYIDTEQGEDDTIAIKNRVCSMAGIDYRKANEHFYILRLRDTEEAQQRWRKILKAIYTVKPTDIFLDGMLDIVNDYNDQVECQPVIRKCMMLATYYDASLWAVLHENPMVDKLVGVLGSITQRKVSEIFTVIKVKQADLKPNEKKANLPDIYFKVKQVKARGRDVADWYFEYVTNAGGWGQPIEIDSETSEPVASYNLEEVKLWIDKAKESVTWPATHSEIFVKIFTPNGVENEKEQKSLIEQCINRRFFIRQTAEEMKKGQRNPRLKLNDEIFCPF
jgi:hypothetical protein